MYTIKEIENKYGLPASTLRFYEKEGILPQIQRNDSGQRRYSDKELQWLQLVIALKETGMSIEEIKRYVELLKQGDSTLDKRKDFLMEHKKTVEQKMNQTLIHLEKINRKMAVYDVIVRGNNDKVFLI
ncbi:MerR family transcriptional regulator [Carnobacterium pleistocenium]|uniref:MerR family transcriptional regulator n=1 Tax=Carnobacterium pleistocenium TaxID=181073 RepID=UPI00054E91A1|nr:MerR family transcriptional regulator [Carnobacterium pleistocenium]